MADEPTIFDLIVRKHREALHRGFSTWPTLELGMPPALGDPRWTDELIIAIWHVAERPRQVVSLPRGARRSPHYVN